MTNKTSNDGTEIQNKVAEEVAKVVKSYERRIASYHNQIAQQAQIISQKDEIILAIQDEANETIQRLETKLTEFEARVPEVNQDSVD